LKSRAGRVAAFLVAALLWLAIAALFSWRLAGKSLDDFFITYRYAQNLVQGNGLVFNPGERVFGTTAPGLALLLAGGHLLTRIPIHWLGTLSTGLALAGIALLLLAEADAEAEAGGRRPEAWIGGTLLLTNTFLWACHGAEGPVVVFLLLLAARWGEDRPLLSGLIAGFAVWCRPDAGLAVGVLGLLLWRERRRLPRRFGLAAAVVLAAGAILALVYFGGILPNSWRAKQAEALGSAGTAGLLFWPASLGLLRRHLGTALPWTLVLGVVGQWPLFKWGGRPGRLLVLQAATLALAYPLLGVNFAPWYILPIVIALLAGVAFAAGAAGRAAAAALEGRRLAPWAGALLALLLLAPALLSIGSHGLTWIRGAGQPVHFEGYRAASLWIRRDSRPQDAIAAMEVGTLAYFSQRRVEDLQGLVTPRSIPFSIAGDPAGAFLAQPTRYMVTRPGLMVGMRKIVRRGWFQKSYQEVALFAPEGEDWTRVYGVKAGVDPTALNPDAVRAASVQPTPLGGAPRGAAHGPSR
jgi:arabinofuranosyltransferase